VCVKTDSKQNHPTCDPANFQDIIFHKDISEDMKRTLVFFHLHCKGCLVCAHISNTYGEKYTLLPHLCMPGRDDSYVPTNSSMYCPQLLRIDYPDKRRELVGKLTNLCTGCLRRRNPSAECFPFSKNKHQPGKPCSSCNGHYLLGTCASCIQLSTGLHK
jgi:hypothetical protein